MELLIIKSQEQYIRVKESAYQLCALDKASVFPLEKLPTVKEHLCRLKEQGLSDVTLSKLIMREEPFEEVEQ